MNHQDNHQNQQDNQWRQFERTNIHGPVWISGNLINESKWRVRNNGHIPHLFRNKKCQRCGDQGYKYRLALQYLENCSAAFHYVCFSCAPQFVVERDSRKVRNKKQYVQNLRKNYNIEKKTIRDQITNQISPNEVENQIIHRFDEFIRVNFTLVGCSGSSPCTLHQLEEEHRPMNQHQRLVLATRPFLTAIRRFAKKSLILQSIYNSVKKINYIYNGRYVFKNQTEAKVCAAIAKISNIEDFPYFLGVPQPSELDQIKYHSDSQAKIFHKYLRIYRQNCKAEGREPAQQPENHPQPHSIPFAIPAGNSNNVLQQKAKKFKQPKIDEGFCQLNGYRSSKVPRNHENTAQNNSSISTVMLKQSQLKLNFIVPNIDPTI